MKKGSIIKDENEEELILLDIKDDSFLCLNESKEVVSRKNITRVVSPDDYMKELAPWAILDLVKETKLKVSKEDNKLINFVKKNNIKKETILDFYKSEDNLYIITDSFKYRYAS